MLLEDLLGVPMLKDARIVAGAGGIGRPVESVNMMDSPDILDYLKPYELTLTTAYAIKDEPDKLVKLVQEMAVRGCAGLGIKTKRYLDRIPDQAKEAADALHLPLLELPINCSLAEAIQQLLSRILEFRTDEMRHALDSHRKFSGIILEGNGLQDMIDALSEAICLPVLLLQADGSLLAKSSRYSRLPLERLSPLCEELISGRRECGKASTVTLNTSALAQYSDLHCYPIHTDQPQAFLFVLTGPSRTDVLSGLTIEQAVNVISFELMKRQAVKERSRRFKYDFFSDVVEGVLTSEADIAKRGNKYGLTADRPYYCAVIKKDPYDLDRSSKDGKPSIPEKEQLYELVKQEAKAEGLRFILFVKQDGLVMLLEEERSAGLQADEPVPLPLQRRMERIVERIEKKADIAVSVGIGNAAARLAKLPQSYRESLDALQTGYQSKKRRFVQLYHVKELNDLLRLLPPEDMAEFIEDTFRGLLEVEDKERAELHKTLRAYYENHCHIADTAKHLYLHRNTVIYRLDKCERLTGRKLRSVSESLRFRAAYQMEDVLRSM